MPVVGVIGLVICNWNIGYWVWGIGHGAWGMGHGKIKDSLAVR